MLSVNDINLLQAQNEGLKKQNKELQAEIKKYAAINEQETKDYAELKAENERLKEEIKEVKKYQYEQEYLEKEIERLKKELKNNKSAYEVELGTYNMECSNLLEENKELAHYLVCMTEQRNKANTTLQEIKAIVCGNYEIIDSQGRKDILKLINKTEIK